LDAAPRRIYARFVVNLLLLLSALLSALTGGGSAMRTPAAAQAISATATAIVSDVRAVRVAQRPQQGRMPLIETLAALPLVMAPPAATEPLYARRRRE
jgi:hypothetical protein